MLRITAITVTCVFCTVGAAFGEIEVWAGGDIIPPPTIDHDDNTIEIEAAGTYGFRAWDGDSALEEIQSITVDSGVTGAVTVTIAWDEYGGNGATDVWTGNLTLASYDVDLDGLEISGNIATTGDFICDNITGAVDIDGDIGVTAGTRKFFVQNATGAIIVHGRLRAYNTLEAETLGDVTIHLHPTQGDIKIKNDYAGTLLIYPSMYGDITVGERDEEGTVTTASDLTGTLDLRASLLGDVDVTDDLATDEGVSGRILVGSDLNTGHILVGGAVTQADAMLPAIHVQGAITGSGGDNPAIEVGGELDGVIAIDGSLDNNISGPEIHVGSINTENLGAITIDYDGYHSGDTWHEDARIEVNTTEYSGNTPAVHIYYIGDCRSDMTNDGVFDGDDKTAADKTESQYATDYPGLHGSRYYHIDADCDDLVTEYDPNLVRFFVDKDCCFISCEEDEFDSCRLDFDNSGSVGLLDLARLLTAYGKCEQDDGYDPLVDIAEFYECINLVDLALLLSKYGQDCVCPGSDGGGGGGGGDGPSYVEVSVVAYDTKGYSGGGFEGEVDHFVFDLKIEVLDPNSDDWIVTGAKLDRYNEATFRLSTAATTPDQYATFVAAPWTTVPGSATADVAGTYDPSGPSGKFTTTGINLAWYDTVESHDGPATVMRIVIDVSEVEGADVSEGFGSVYFGHKIGEDDIQVGDLASGTFTAESVPDAESLSGSFWVTGE